MEHCDGEGKKTQFFLYKNKIWRHCKEEGIRPLNVVNICVREIENQ